MPRKPTGEQDSKILTFRADADLLDGLNQLFERDGMAQSEAIRRALREFLKAKGIEPSKTGQRKLKLK
jgi:metal-responsive CopG/Arc/MetJ family transcriptional regulator